MKCQLFIIFLIIVTIHGDGQVYCGRRLALALAYLCNEQQTEKRAQPGGKEQQIIEPKENLQYLAEEQMMKRTQQGEEENRQKQQNERAYKQFLEEEKENILFEEEENRKKGPFLEYLDIVKPINIVKRGIPSFALAQKQNLWIKPQSAKSMNRGKRQIISECCEKSCTIDEMLTYCPE